MEHRIPQPGDIYIAPDGAYLMLIKKEERSDSWYQLYSLTEERVRHATIQALNLTYKLITDN